MDSELGRLGTVLVVGGCGFLGTHLTQALRDEPSCSNLYVLDRAAPRNPIQGVTYIQGSIFDPSVISHVFQTAKPNAVFHSASPNASFPTHGRKDDFYKTNVQGTHILLKYAAEFQVKAFVYTSSAHIYAYPPHTNITEDHPTLDNVAANPATYPFTKAVADSLVLAASTPDFGTVSLRISHLYGDGDSQMIPAALDACAGARPLFRLGDGENLMESLSTRNAAAAHILAAKALLSKMPGVNGEAFNITEGSAVKFWDSFIAIWSMARGKNVEGDLYVIPAWIIWILTVLIEWLYWIFTLGTVQPKGVEMLEREVIEYCLLNHTYDGSKARDRLGFSPVNDYDGVMKRATELELKRRAVLALGKRK